MQSELDKWVVWFTDLFGCAASISFRIVYNYVNPTTNSSHNQCIWNHEIERMNVKCIFRYENLRALIVISGTKTDVFSVQGAWVRALIH